jgi:hypothetical protein
MLMNFNIIQSCCECGVFVSLIEIYAKCKVLPHNLFIANNPNVEKSYMNLASMIWVFDYCIYFISCNLFDWVERPNGFEVAYNLW